MSQRTGTPFSYVAAVFLIIFLAIGSGLINAALDGRLADRESIDQVSDQVINLPNRFGDWVQVDQVTLPQSAERILNCYGYANRLYQNSESGAQVTLTLLYGPRGPISVHTPEICYSGRGVKPLEDRTKFSLSDAGNEHSFWRITLGDSSALPVLQVAYAWSDGNQWIASEYPRFWPTSSLFKIQLSSVPDSKADEEFLKAFLPRWTQLFNEPEKAE